MRILRPLILGLVGLLTLTTSLALTSARALAKSPVVVELFTSQGCSSCLKADDLMGEVADRPGILVLTYAVDYWDYLGWRDTFAKEDYSARQRAYMKRMSGREVYTPQIVVNGTAETAAIHADKVDQLIATARRAKGLPSPQIRQRSDTRISVGSGRFPKGGAEVWLVRYDPSDQAVEIKRGENRGKTMVYHNAVRDLVRLGSWTGRARSYTLPTPETDSAGEGLESVILVQGAKGGRMLGSLSLKAPESKP
jgi:hypothetical protein